MRNIKDNIKRWNKDTFGNIFYSKMNVLEELKVIQDNIQMNGYVNVSNEEEDLKLVDLDNIISKEDTYWRQRSGKIYLKEGDKNMK